MVRGADAACVLPAGDARAARRAPARADGADGDARARPRDNLPEVQLRDEGFRGIVCIVTAATGETLGQLARSPGVDLVGAKGDEVHVRLLRLLAERRAQKVL